MNQEQNGLASTTAKTIPPPKYTRPLRPPIAATVAYEFESLQHCADTYGHKVQSHAYSRLSNPTVEALEESVSARTGALATVAYASGMAAISALYLAFGRPGKNIVSSSRLYGGTLALQHNLQEFAIEFRYVDFADAGAVEDAIDDDTVMLFSEPIANPAMNWYDFAAIRDVAGRKGVVSVLDNTNTTGLFDALAWADVDITSATKYVGGHGAGLGGLVSCSELNLQQNRRYQYLDKPSGDFAGQSPLAFGGYALPRMLRGANLRNFGACLSPFNAYLFQLGLDTLDLRMRDISKRCLELALYCQSHSSVDLVLHPEIGTAADGIERYFPRGTGGLFSFTLHGGMPAIQRFFDALSLIPVATNIGDSRTIVQHVESTSHSQLSREKLDAAGIPSGLLRVSVGLEAIEKLLAEFNTALGSAQ